MEEVWRDMKDYKGLYQVSNLGRVRSLDKIVNSANQYGAVYTRKRKGKILKPFIDGKGNYLQVTFYTEGTNKRNYLVHRLVAQEFIPNPDNKLEVNHIDGNKLNNSIDNLEWVTAKENMQHASKNGLLRRKLVV